MVIYHAVLRIEDGKRNEYLKNIKESNMIADFLNQDGCVFYTMGASIMDDDSVIVCDAWINRVAFEAHCKSKLVVKTWNELQKKYVTEINNRTFEFEN